MSYGADRDVLVAKLAYYFESMGTGDIQFEDEIELLKDSKSKASTFLRKLKDYGWIEYDIGNDQKIRVIMPNHSVTLIQTINSITNQKEMEYQSEISAIYSLLTNEELLSRPYVQVVEPVYDHTLSLFTELKKLNTSIRKYIEEITSDKSAEEILENFFSYHEEVGSKAYHRIKTNDNVSRFRNTILILSNWYMNNDTVEVIKNLISEELKKTEVNNIRNDQIIREAQTIPHNSQSTWECKNCGNINYSSENKCLKCGQLKNQ